MVTKSCAQCGEEFQSERRRSKFCSRACYWLSERRVAAEPERTKTCERCGATFTHPHGRGYRQWAKQRYCSRACLYASRRAERVDFHGYVIVKDPDHPLAGKNGYVLAHRRVVYDAGVEVPPGHHVHHRNGDKTDNRLENLEVLSKSEHHTLHNLRRRRRKEVAQTHP